MASNTCKYVRPIISTNWCVAHSRVLGLYKACYRFIPFMAKQFDIPKNEQQIRLKIRERFYKNACVQDLRVVDLLIIKGYMELNEITHAWQQNHHLLNQWKPTVAPLPKTFIEKFIAGND